jgi:hypothetical protein
MMKTSLALSLFLTCLAGHAQGTFNASNNFIPEGFATKAFVLDGQCQPLSKTAGRVDILDARDGSFLSPNGPAGIALTLDGLFFINGLSVPGVATGGSAQVVIRAWDSSTGSTYDSAGARGQTLVTIRNLGGGNVPSATFAADSDFVGVGLGRQSGPCPQLCPEPSSVLLTTLGMVGACWGFCRKS